MTDSPGCADPHVKSLVGGPPADGVEDMLLSCHQKIRKFMTTAARLAGGEPATAEDAGAAAAALVRYFEQALPRHAEDEDESLRPRLEAAGYEGDLERLAREHDEIDALVDQLMPLWTSIAAEPACRPALAPELAPPTKALADLFDRHLGWEEEHLIPRLAPLLGDSGLAEARAEMRARRDRDVTPAR